jgi:hypothetical protein
MGLAEGLGDGIMNEPLSEVDGDGKGWLPELYNIWCFGIKDNYIIEKDSQTPPLRSLSPEA